MSKHDKRYVVFIFLLILIITYLHYHTSTSIWQFHLIFMELYFVPILIAAFKFGIRGGLGAAIVVSVFYLPHVLLQWGGFVETNLLRFLQIVLYNVIGFLTGLKAQREMENAEKYRKLALQWEQLNKEQKIQNERLLELERELRAADRLAIIGELTATLAHEVRNPLASIRGAVEIIRDQVPDKQKDGEFFHILFQEIERLDQVVANYLSFAQKQSWTRVKVDVHELLSMVKQMLESRASKQGVNLILDLPEKKQVFKADALLLRQVLINLLLNALQASERGSTIRLQARVEDSEGAKRLHLSVIDQGRGIAREHLDKIFEPFFTTRSNGTGLGLAIVKRIADENNWEINVQSEEGKGSTFTLKIPFS